MLRGWRACLSWSCFVLESDSPLNLGLFEPSLNPPPQKELESKHEAVHLSPILEPINFVNRPTSYRANSSTVHPRTAPTKQQPNAPLKPQRCNHHAMASYSWRSNPAPYAHLTVTIERLAGTCMYVSDLHQAQDETQGCRSSYRQGVEIVRGRNGFHRLN